MGIFRLVWHHFAEGLFVVVGDGGIILTSSDGFGWQKTRTESAGERLQGIGYGKGQFVAVGRRTHKEAYGTVLDGSLILTSSNAVSWISQPVSRVSYLECISFGQNAYVAVGDYGTILTSSNGQDWVLTMPPELDDWYECEAVTFGDGIFVAVGNDGLVLSSRDGWNWTRRYSGFSSRNLRSIAYANGLFTIVGNNDTILQSGSIWPCLSGSSHPDHFEIAVAAEPGVSWTIEVSTNLMNWIGVDWITNQQCQYVWRDNDTTNTARRFYRLRNP